MRNIAFSNTHKISIHTANGALATQTEAKSRSRVRRNKRLSGLWTASCLLFSALAASACAGEGETTYGDLLVRPEESAVLVNDTVDQTTRITAYVIDEERSRSNCANLPLIPDDATRTQQLVVESGGASATGSLSTNSNTLTDIETGDYTVVIVGFNSRGVPVSRACREGIIIREDETTELFLSLISEAVPIDGRYRMSFDFSQGFPDALSAVSRLGNITCGFLNLGTIGSIDVCGSMESLRGIFSSVRVELDWICREPFQNAVRCDVEVIEVNGQRAPASCNFFRGSWAGSTQGATVYNTSGGEIDIDGDTFAQCLVDLNIIDPTAFGITTNLMTELFDTLFGNGDLTVSQMTVVGPDDEQAGILQVQGSYNVDADLFSGLEVGFDETAYRRAGN